MVVGDVPDEVAVEGEGAGGDAGLGVATLLPGAQRVPVAEGEVAQLVLAVELGGDDGGGGGGGYHGEEGEGGGGGEEEGEEQHGEGWWCGGVVGREEGRSII